MKITGTKSYVKVEFEEKVIKIKGELLVGGFVAYIDSIEKWESPYGAEKIDELEKQRIMDMVINETKDSHFVITFE